ncbi:MAG: hypothetical protein Tsb0027_22060 [Wenzhouxiangellaceae bacterium]
MTLWLFLSTPLGYAQQAVTDDQSNSAAAQQAVVAQLGAAGEPPLDAERLLAGEVMLRFNAIDDEVQRVQGWVLIKAQRELVWSLLVDCDRALDYVPNMRACEVRDSGKSEAGHAFDITYHRVKPYFFLPAVENVFRADYLPPEQIRFRKAGGDLVHFQGSWQFLAPAEQQTLLRYDAEVDLRASVNVRGERRMIRKDVREMLAAIRQMAEQAATQASIEASTRAIAE